MFPNFKEWVPDRIRFWIYILILAAFQFSNGVYFSAMPNMIGSLSITINDTKMISYAMFAGLTLYFPLAFRLKFRFTSRTNLIIASLGLILCNVVVPYINSVPLLVIISFIAGFLRLYGTFECLSILLPKITPKHNYAVFLSFVFFVVLGVINLFDMISMQIIYYYDWYILHHIAKGLLILVILTASVLMKHFRIKPKMPLKDVDWLGMILWAIFILGIMFIIQYGEQMNWFASPYLRAAAGISTLALAFNIFKIVFTRNPYIEFGAFKTRNLFNLMLLFLFLGIFLSVKNVLQSRFVSAVLDLDSLHNASLKWLEFIGSFIGTLFAWFALTRLKWSKKLLTFIGMSSVVMYVGLSYFIITPYTSIQMLYFPLVLLGFGQLVVFISLTVYAHATTPFKYYFQVLALLGFIRTGVASPIGDTILNRSMAALMSKHLSIVGVGNNAFLLALKELYGWVFIFGIMVLILIAISRFKKYIPRPLPILINFTKTFTQS